MTPRTKLYFGDTTSYQNTPEEEQAVRDWRIKYLRAKHVTQSTYAIPDALEIYRDMYRSESVIRCIDKNGVVTNKFQKYIRKVAYELVEQKVDVRIPAPKMSPRHHGDVVPVNLTEALLRYEMDKILSEEVVNDAEHATLIDKGCWLKVTWDPCDSSHTRHGQVHVEVCPIDTVFPQPGVTNYKNLQYIFHSQVLTIAQIYDTFGRQVSSATEDDLVNVVTVYYLSEARVVGRVVWTENDANTTLGANSSPGICLANDEEWQIGKTRRCTKCGASVPVAAECPVCGSTSFEYKSSKTERLTKKLVGVSNPFREGDVEAEDENVVSDVLPVGTEIERYLVRQLPFVPYRHSKIPNSLFGISEIELCMTQQDLINKFMNKAERKSAASKSYIAKLRTTAITDPEEEISYVDCETAQEVSAMQMKQMTADITEELTMANLLYSFAKSTSGVTDTDQGKYDATARSGKAKQIQMLASQQRAQSAVVLRNSSFAGVYEMMFKYLMAYCDEPLHFVKVMPDGSKSEAIWSKYLLLAKDDDGNLYYKDDYAWSVDTASNVTEDRASMWQLIDNDFINGTLGTTVDPYRALKMYWQMKEQYGYPTARYALDFLESTEQHLPAEIEKALVANPEAVQMALSILRAQSAENSDTQGIANRGGEPGRQGNGATHAANVSKTNNKDRVQAGAAGATSGGQKAGEQIQGDVLGQIQGGVAE